MLDLVLAVKDSEAWHKANLERSAPTKTAVPQQSVSPNDTAMREFDRNAACFEYLNVPPNAHLLALMLCP